MPSGKPLPLDKYLTRRVHKATPPSEDPEPEVITNAAPCEACGTTTEPDDLVRLDLARVSTIYPDGHVLVCSGCYESGKWQALPV